MDLAFDDIYGWLVLGLNGTGPFLNFLRSCSNDFLTQKVYFLAVNYVRGLYLVQVSVILIGQQGFGHFFRYRPLLPIGCRAVHCVQIVRQCRRKTTNTAPITLCAIQAEMHNNIALVISGNDKNKKLTLLRQRKLSK
jgi:hypothetical protein